MYLDENANVSDEVRRIINNGFFSNHPFKYSSFQLESYLRIIKEVRMLPHNDFLLCLDAVKRVVQKNSNCAGCYGKGLAYVKRLTAGIEENVFKIHEQLYDQFINSRKYPDYEEQLSTLISRWE